MWRLNSKDYNNDIMQRNHTQFKNAINILTQLYGIPMSSSKLERLMKDTQDRKHKINLDIKNRLRVDRDINYTGRKLRDNHIGYLLEKHFGIENVFCKQDSDNVSFNENTRDHFRSVTLDQKEVAWETLEWVQEYKRLSDLESAITSMKTEENVFKHMIQQEKYPFDAEFKDIKDTEGNEIDTKNFMDLSDPDIFYIKPIFETMKTYRLQGSSPNIQGMQKEIKECITAPKGSKIIQVDIKGQELNILINAYLGNKGIKEEYRETLDPYISVMRVLGIPEKKLYRDLIKIPMLGMIRGMSPNSAKRKIEQKLGTTKSEVDMNKKVDEYSQLLNMDTIYSKRVTRYTDERLQGFPVMTQGYFGTVQELEGTNKNSNRRQVMSGLFQITGAETMCLSCLKMMEVIAKKYNKDYNQARIVLPVFDEIILLAKDENVEYMKQTVNEIMKPQIDDWITFAGEIKVGQSY